MKREWQDATIYSRGDKTREPSTWHHIVRYKGGYLNISVHRHIDFPKDVWLLTCHSFFIKHQLKNKNINKAKREALRKVKKELKLAINAFRRKRNDPIPYSSKQAEGSK